MDQADINAHWMETILYYCEQQSAGPRYSIDGTDVGTWYVDGNGNIAIDTWLLDTQVVPEPTVISSFTSYVLADVLDFYKYKYELPASIIATQPWTRLTSTEISNVEITSSINGTIVFDTTASTPKIYNGTNWVSL
jgi:hypothetical protein